MKLATLKQGGRDGALVVVSRDLTRYEFVPQIAQNLQQVLDDWDKLFPQLVPIYDRLNAKESHNSHPFAALDCHAPLPRAYQWLDGSAYVNHVELVRRARGAELPPEFWTDPLMYQGGSNSFIGPCDKIKVPNQAWGIDLEAEIAVITDDVSMGCSLPEASAAIRLLMLVNDVSLRNLIPAELAKGFGFVQSKPASAFSPIALTPDELGTHWRDHKVHLPLTIHINGALFGRPNAGEDMTFNFAQLIAHAAKTRDLEAGTIIGSGTVSNKQGGLFGSSVANGGLGYACLAEVRMYETIESGQAKTEFLKFNDRVKIEMFDQEGKSLFGAIDQSVERLP